MIAVYNDVKWVSHPRGEAGTVWVGEMPRAELIVFGDDTILQGAWRVTLRDGMRDERIIGGCENDARTAKLRARVVYEALTADLKELEG